MNNDLHTETRAGGRVVLVDGRTGRIVDREQARKLVSNEHQCNMFKSRDRVITCRGCGAIIGVKED